MVQKIITPIEGSADFPTNKSETLELIETLAVQNIEAVKTENTLEDALFNYEIKDGKVIEEAVIEAAKAQAFDKNAFDRAAKDPTLHVKYFNNFEDLQYQTTIREDDIRAIIANKGVGVEKVAAETLGTLTSGSDYDNFTKDRGVIYKAAFKDYSKILGGTPKNAKGIIFALRDMYNHLKSNNDDLTGAKFISKTKAADIRIAVSSKVLNLIDVTELANVFNLEKEEMFGKLIVIDVDDLTDHTKDGFVYVYDRKALGRGRRLYEYENERVVKGRYTNAYLTTSYARFHNDLFKGAYLDCTKAMTAEKGGIIEVAAA